jgi:DcaP outer membrane protein
MRARGAAVSGQVPSLLSGCRRTFVRYHEATMQAHSAFRGASALLALFVIAFGPAHASAQPSAPAEGQQTVEAMVIELRKLVADQRALIDGQSQRIDALEKDLAALKQQPAPAPAQLPAPAPPGVQASAPTGRDDRQARSPELPKEIVSAGDFPGSLRIPGTNAALKIGGQARMMLINTLGPLGTDDKFVTSSIPVGDQEAGEDARTVFSPVASRFGFDLRTPLTQTTLRTFIEGDFAGASNTFRLRHAYMQTRRWVFGQTWSTFSDPEAEPIGIDFEGLNAISLFRQPQIRFVHWLRENLVAALAVENPVPDLTGTQGVSLTPDFVARVRWQPAAGARRLLGAEHIQAAVLARTLRGELSDQPSTTFSTGGFGVNVSGVVVPPWNANDRVKFATNNGWGIGKYITDLGSLGGQDAIYDPVLNTLRALPVSSGYVGYERQWRPTITSAFTYGIVNVANLDIQADDALKRTQRTTFNLTWSPVPQADIVIEFLFGTRVNKNGQKGTSSQLQSGWTYRF